MNEPGQRRAPACKPSCGQPDGFHGPATSACRPCACIYCLLTHLTSKVYFCRTPEAVSYWKYGTSSLCHMFQLWATVPAKSVHWCHPGVRCVQPCVACGDQYSRSVPCMPIATGLAVGAPTSTATGSVPSLPVHPCPWPGLWSMHLLWVPCLGSAVAPQEYGNACSKLVNCQAVGRVLIA